MIYRMILVNLPESLYCPNKKKMNKESEVLAPTVRNLMSIKIFPSWSSPRNDGTAKYPESFAQHQGYLSPLTREVHVGSVFDHP
jgi:hypothetical protein